MKKKCHVLDCTGESLPVLDLSEWMNDNVGYLYLFGSWEKMQQMSAILSERHAKRRKPRVVAVTRSDAARKNSIFHTNLAAAPRAFLKTKNARFLEEVG